MKVVSWVKSIFQSKRLNTTSMESIPVLRTETPTKIIETRIKPIKIPTIVDVGGKLGVISREIIELKNDIVTKSWFKTEYEDTGSEVIGRLMRIEDALILLKNNILQFNDNLSKFTKTIDKIELKKPPSRIGVLGIPGQILDLLKEGGQTRYKDLSGQLNISDPTLSKYLKMLCKTNKIKRKKIGKAVYYELAPT